MKISSKARYAVAAMVELAARPGDYISVSALAQIRDIPRTFLEQLLLRLKREGLTASRRGPDGGYTLALAPSQIRLGDIYTAVEGPLNLRNGSARVDTDGVSEVVSTDERVWGGLEDTVLGFLNGVTLEDLMEPESASGGQISVAHQYTFSI